MSIVLAPKRDPGIVEATSESWYLPSSQNPRSALDKISFTEIITNSNLRYRALERSRRLEYGFNGQNCNRRD
jgi:hypothetical protein